MRVIGLRHGQSAYNLLGLCNADPAVAVDLTAEGARQAQQAIKHLHGEALDRVFCSPLLRAARTAQVVASGFGLEPVVEPRLGDIHSGCEGRPVAEYLAAIAHDPVDARVGDGESLREYYGRVAGFLEELASGTARCVLLVAHEETLRMFAAHYAREPLEMVAGRPYANALPYVFQSDSGNL